MFLRFEELLIHVLSNQFSIFLTTTIGTTLRDLRKTPKNSKSLFSYHVYFKKNSIYILWMFAVVFVDAAVVVVIVV